MPTYTIRANIGQPVSPTAPNMQNTPIAPTQEFTNSSTNNAINTALLLGVARQATNVVTSSIGQITGDNSLQRNINIGATVLGFGIGLVVNPAVTLGALTVTAIKTGIDTFVEQRDSRIVSEYRQQELGILVDGSRNR